MHSTNSVCATRMDEASRGRPRLQSNGTGRLPKEPMQRHSLPSAAATSEVRAWLSRTPPQPSGSLRLPIRDSLSATSRVSVTQSATAAVDWYRKAAAQNNKDAQYELGVRYQKGDGVGKSQATAIEWYRKAAEQGHANAQCELGFCYQQGVGVEKSESIADDWFRKSADQGNKDAKKALKKKQSWFSF